MPDFEYALFPGRHHLFTAYQAEYLGELLTKGVPDIQGETVKARQVVIAITSGDHSHTRRNPVAGHRRVQLADRLLADHQLSGVVCLIADVPYTDRYVKYLIESVAHDDGPQLTPANCLIACSTPDLIKMFTHAGYTVAPVELAEDGSFHHTRPWEVLEGIVADQGIDGTHAQLMDAGSRELWGTYHLVQHVLEAHQDPLLSDDAEITQTRNYDAYRVAFDEGADRKWQQIRDLVKPGRIVDIGCGAGALLRQAAQDPRLVESDLFGIEATRPLFEECQHRKRLGAFANPNTFFHQRNFLSGAIFPDRSVDTTLTVALCHEIWSYLGEDALYELVRRIYDQTRPGGVWINLDVLGPADPNRLAAIKMPVDDPHTAQVARHIGFGRDTAHLLNAIDLDDIDPSQRQQYLDSLTPLQNWVQFCHDWAPAAHPQRRIDHEDWCLFVPLEGPVDATPQSISLEAPRWALMEWLTTKSYTDSWQSEMHESFTHYDFERWSNIIQEAGFRIAQGSQALRNEWLVENRFKTIGSWQAGMSGGSDDWPATHVLMVARRSA